MARIAIVGSGYVGVCTGVVFAEWGHHVTLLDKDPERVAALAAGRPPFYEPGIDEALGRVMDDGATATQDVAAAVKDADAVFVCVGTPSRDDGSIDLTAVKAAVADVADALPTRHGPVIVVKSTVTPGTTRHVVAPLLATRAGPPGVRYELAVNPEFLKEGAALADARAPDRIVVGADEPATAQRVLALYKAQAPHVVVDATTAETVKYAANAFLAVKVGFSNELANVCRGVGVDWYAVAEGVGLDARIGPQFLRAGAGFGGSCFPKDLRALRAVAAERGVLVPMLEAVLEGNDRQPLVVVDLVRQALGDLAGARVALLGLAFKPETDDVRDTRALPIHEALVAAGADVVVHDPMAAENFLGLAPAAQVAESWEKAVEGADALVVQTEWEAYRAIDPARLKALMRRPIVVDGRRTFDAAALLAAGVAYHAVGLGGQA